MRAKQGEALFSVHKVNYPNLEGSQIFFPDLWYTCLADSILQIVAVTQQLLLTGIMILVVFQSGLQRRIGL